MADGATQSVKFDVADASEYDEDEGDKTSKLDRAAEFLVEKQNVGVPKSRTSRTVWPGHGQEPHSVHE